MSMEILIGLIVLALAFDFMNGFHDAANSIATIVSSSGQETSYRSRRLAWHSSINFPNCRSSICNCGIFNSSSNKH